MMIQTYSMRWVKKHCTFQSQCDGTGEYVFGEHKSKLYTPNMNRSTCGKLFTVLMVRTDLTGETFVIVQETAFSIPLWLLTKKSQKQIKETLNACTNA